MKVESWLKEQPNIFEELMNVNPELNFIQEYTPEVLQLLYTNLYSDRTVRNKMKGKTTKDLAILVNLAYSESWSKEIKAFLDTHDIGIDVIQATTGDSESTGDRELSSDAVAKSSPYNAQEGFLDTGGQTDVVSEGNIGSNKHSSETTTQTIDAVYKYKSLFQESIITARIYNDINKLLTLNIYKGE